jgi:hypothetical protein
MAQKTLLYFLGIQETITTKLNSHKMAEGAFLLTP